MDKSIPSKYSRTIKILYLPILQSSFMENMRFLQKNLKKKMEK